MTTTQKFIEQMEQEGISTRKMLSVVPDGKFDWQPHPKSMTIRKLVTHLAEISGWVTITLKTDRLDVAAQPEETINTRAELLAYFDEMQAMGLDSLGKATDEDLAKNWTMSYGERVISVRPKEDVLRMCMSQIIHHRAQLGVFLRLLDVPIPGTYGPSADEMGM
ncbi:MAG: DinB family protein [Flavipsychrobacter sp.]|nr:DinB family protein [Flavipsychrobacter sp.]